MSTELVNLSGALSEWSGGQISATEVTEILGKAVLGEREQLKSLGISIQEADVKNRLAEKGLKNLTGTALQQAKAMATLELITEKSTDAQSAYAKNSDTLVRRQAEVSAKITEVSEKLATVMFPIFEELVSIADAAANVLTDVADSILYLTDPVSAASKAFDDQTRKVMNLEEELNPLLERYEELSNKSGKSEEEQAELAKVIQRIGEITPGAIEQIDEYGNVLSINATASKEFLEAEKARLEFVNKESIAAIEEEIAGMEGLLRLHKRAVDTGKGGILQLELEPQTIANSREEVAKLSQEIKGAKAELDRLKGIKPEKNKAATDNKPPAPSPTAEERAAAAEAAEKLRKQREKDAEKARKDRERAAEKEIKDLAKKLTKLQEIEEKFIEEARLKKLSEEDRKIAELAAKFDEQIEIAQELEIKKVKGATEQRLALERLKANAIAELEAELFQEKLIRESEKEAEQTAAELEALQKRETEKKEALETIDSEIRQILFSEREIALQETEEHFQKLLLLAQENGIDTGDILIAHRRAQAKINEEFDKKDEEQRVKALAKHAKILAKSFKDTESEIKNAQKALSDAGIESVAISKALTLTQLGFDTASAISSLTKHSEANPANAVSFGAAGIAQFATGLIRIFANIAQAKKILTSTPQKKKGGYHKVTGADDGITYNARYIGSPQSGMLPSTPVVLASEAGAEYFVSNRDLQNPVIANYTRIIDNISKGRTRQFVEGGFNTTNQEETSPTSPTNDNQDAIQSTLIIAINDLNTILERGIVSIIPDDSVIAIRERFNELNELARGSLG